MKEDMRPGFSMASAIIVLVLFFASGFAGLVYEVFWLKKLVILFGNTSRAAATTLATFFLGLATGNAVWGRRAVKTKFPLKTYAFLEAGVALSAFLYFLLLDLYYFIYSPLFQMFGNYPSLFVAVKLLLAVLILFPPAFLMGGTFPVMSQYWVRSPGTLGQSASLLYAVNTLGAALGAYTAGFHLPLLFGYRSGYILTITTTCIIALVAWWVGRNSPGLALPVQPSKSKPVKSVKQKTHFTFWAIWVLAFLSGFVALGLEVLWTRMFAQVLQNSVYSFSMILSVFIIALALGSAVVSFLARTRVASHVVLFVLLSGSGFLVGISPFIFSWITGGIEYLGKEIDILNILKLVVLVIFLPGVFLGSVFPYLMKISEPLTQAVGKTVGNITAFNTAGAILGSLLTGFLFLNFFGLWATIRIMAFVYFLTALFMVESIPGKKLFYRTVPICGLFLMVSVFETSGLPLIKIDPVEKNEHIVEVWEGSSANVAVIKQDHFLKILVNNHYRLGGTRSRKVEEFQAHLPIFLHPKPNSVFFLGMGTGITAGASLQHPVKKVVVTELIPEVVEASRKYFKPYIHGLFEDPRVMIVAEDGRNYLLGTREDFDLIIADLFLPWKAGTGSLYTLEHFETVRKRLNTGGLFAQWLPLYQVSSSEFGIIVRTMLDVFPLVTLWRGDFLGSRYIALLIGHKDGESLDPKILNQRFLATQLSTQAVRELFDTHHFSVETPLLPLFYYCGNLSAAKTIFDKFRINTDDLPLIEYYAPLLNRKQAIEKNPFFVRFELINFLDRLLHDTPLRQDRFINKFTKKHHSLVHAGFRLHKARILKIDASGEEFDRELNHFRKEVLTEGSVKKLFVPIKSKEEALRYYLFLMKNLGATWEDCAIYIVTEDDYNSPDLRQWIRVPYIYKKKLGNRVTEIENITDGYMITLIGFNPTFKMEFFERKLEIHFDGTIKEISHKTLIDLNMHAFN